MSTFNVVIEEVIVNKHPDADLLELARVGLYDAVVLKGQFSTGDKAIYIPEQAVLPQPVIDAMGLDGKLAGREKNRVKAVRLRGALSQGLVLGLDKAETLVEGNLALSDDLRRGAVEAIRTESSGYDLAEALGIVKYVPPIPVHMSGDIENGSDVMKWVDIENIQRYPDLFQPGDAVFVTEKIHGTCFISTFTFEQDELVKTQVTSKGLNSDHLALQENPLNLYWANVERYNVKGFAEAVKAELEGWEIHQIAVFGEIFGAGVQDLKYGAKQNDIPFFAVFDIAVRTNAGTVVWIDQKTVIEWASDFGISTTPVLFEGAYDFETIKAVSAGKEAFSGSEAHTREGVVIRELVETNNGHRKIAKFINESYLLRKGGTEYN